MTYIDSQDPSTFGWGPHGPAGRNVIEFAYDDGGGHGALVFAGGIDSRMERSLRHALNTLVPHIIGGLYRPGSQLVGSTQVGGDSTITSANAQYWEQYGGEDRYNRNANQWSMHAWWIAYDINSGHNPNGAQPAGGPFRLPLNTQELLDAEFGVGYWLWGGSFNGTKDTMHIECHASPSEVAAWEAAHPTLGLHDGGATPATPTPPVVPTTDWLTDLMTDPTQAQVDAFVKMAGPGIAKAILGSPVNFAYSDQDPKSKVPKERQTNKVTTIGQLIGGMGSFTSRAAFRLSVLMGREVIP